ncbi:endo-1,4-beta-xylanase [Paractinoplanes globisporus]|uniref:Beta-xylanase n=1 Tax=Paractinoplanes globisporus TaxID=113565 RepID=A0ABW6WBM4_9ACTN|nr:endo-1,4-beta-xylanase [Actinoplanes globisporus]
MRRTHRIVAVVAAAAAVVLTGGSAAYALGTPASAPSRFHPPADSLGALAAPINLRIGNAVNMDKLNVDATYTSLVANQYSTVTPENVMKWEVIEPTQGQLNFAPADQLVSFAQQHNQLVRGHTLLWHNQLPGWLTTGVSNGTISNAQLRDILKRHIFDEAGHFRGKIWQWDVANEVFANAWDPNPLPNGMNGDNFWVSHLGVGIVADAFRWAHQADPHALLFYNDFNIGGEDGTNAKADAVYAWVKSVRAQGVPIQGVGNQGHLDTQYGFSGAKLQDDLARYASLGVKVAITEADVRTFVETTDSLQTPTDSLAQFAQPFEFDQMLKACLAVSSCLSFTIWGVDDADSWVPGVFTGEGYATLHDTNLQPKTAYTTLQQDLRLSASGAPRRPGGGH